MSAAAARRRKQLAARRENKDVVGNQLEALLKSGEDTLEETTAYEALQLAQSQVRKKVIAGEFAPALQLCFDTALLLLQKRRVSVASQLLTLLVECLRETHTPDSEEWIKKLSELTAAHDKAMDEEGATLPHQEAVRLHRLQRDWLRECCNWSSDLGKIKYGNNALQALLARQSWKLAGMEEPQVDDIVEDEDEIMDLQCDAVQHMALAELPLEIVAWLKTLPEPTADETKSGHTCPPATRDALLTRSILLMVAMENLRDANILLREYMNNVETRDIKMLSGSYTKKEDGIAPSHVIFCSMLLRICEKDVKTAPLFSWLLRSFRRELDGLHKSQVVMGYTTKIGQSFFNLQPPPSMLNMVENMMNMMGGGGGGPGGMNPAMMQAALAQMQQGM